MKLSLKATLLIVWIFSLPAFAQPGITFTTMLYFGGTNGETPCAGLIQDTNGNFYGTTYQGGQYGDGTVFKITPDWTIHTLVSFHSTNGSYPGATLIQGNDGNLYGTTYSGGTESGGDGTVFSITTNGVFNFSVGFAGTNGASPEGLVQGSDDNFYGMTLSGGLYVNPGHPESFNHGTIFKITPDGIFTSLYALHPATGSTNVGMSPIGGLIFGPDGALYGPTTYTTSASDYGTIFKIDTNDTFNTLFVFNGADGSNPTGPLVVACDGNFYGLTMQGGLYNWGTVFRMSIDGTLTNIFSFNGTNGSVQYYGASPGAITRGLVQGSDGNLYGETLCGGPGFTGPETSGGTDAYGHGTLFQITTNGAFTSLYSLGTNANDGTYPVGGLLQAADGNFYGVTSQGSSNAYGTVFRLSMPLPPIFLSVIQTNQTLTFACSTVATRTYQLQYTTNLFSANWANLDNSFVATNGTTSFSDPIDSDSQRFYRIALLQ
jgi:uncharacterized repeat protein (TIGR03803 family)